MDMQRQHPWILPKHSCFGPSRLLIHPSHSSQPPSSPTSTYPTLYSAWLQDLQLSDPFIKSRRQLSLQPTGASPSRCGTTRLSTSATKLMLIQPFPTSARWGMPSICSRNSSASKASSAESKTPPTLSPPSSELMYNAACRFSPQSSPPSPQSGSCSHHRPAPPPPTPPSASFWDPWAGRPPASGPASHSSNMPKTKLHSPSALQPPYRHPTPSQPSTAAVVSTSRRPSP